jgi:hypothetical protein
MTRPYIFPRPESEDRTVTPPPYQPWLAMPSIVTSMDPLWKNCAGYVAGWKDPPRAMYPTNSVDSPKITATPMSKDTRTEAQAVKETAKPGPSPPKTATTTPQPDSKDQDDMADDPHIEISSTDKIHNQKNSDGVSVHKKPAAFSRVSPTGTPTSGSYDSTKSGRLQDHDETKKIGGDNVNSQLRFQSDAQSRSGLNTQFANENGQWRSRSTASTWGSLGVSDLASRSRPTGNIYEDSNNWTDPTGSSPARAAETSSKHRTKNEGNTISPRPPAFMGLMGLIAIGFFTHS